MNEWTPGRNHRRCRKLERKVFRETASPWGGVFVREHARRPVPIEAREAQRLTCGLFDHACTVEVVEVLAVKPRGKQR